MTTSNLTVRHKLFGPAGTGRSGFTLVEVMVAAVLLTFMATSLVSLFLQNVRFARALALRTVATTTAIGLAEQIRANPYADHALRHNDPTASFIDVEIFDPTDATAAQGMVKVSLPLNSVDGDPKNSDWTEVTLPMVLNDDGKTTRLPVHMRFWLTSQIRQPTITKDQNGKEVTVTRCQLFEIALIYQWRNPNYSETKWHSGVIRIVTPNTDMNVPDVPVKA